MDELLGSRYVLHESIGQGGMGRVYRGTVRETEAPVAVKMLKPELVADPDIVARFIQERSILLTIKHANIVRVIDLVVEGQTLAIVMEYIEGKDLRHELLAKRTLPPAEVARHGCELLDGLAAVHAAGIVHRDVKPENLLVDTSGNRPELKLTDFGVARLTYGSLTKVSSLIGTPEYMAPELADHESATSAADLYSAGIVLYEMLAGRTPFAGGHPVAVLRRHIDEPPPPIPGAPIQLWALIATLLAKDPDRRPESAAQLAAALAIMRPSLADLPALEPMPAPVFPPIAARRPAVPPEPQTVQRGTPPSPPSPPSPAPPSPASPLAPAVPQALPPYELVITPTPQGPPVYAPPLIYAAPPPPSRSSRSLSLPIIVSALIAVLIVGGAAAARTFLLHSSSNDQPKSVRPVTYVFQPQAYSDGLLIVRRWTLSGPGGSVLTESVSASSSDGQPHQVTFFEAIPTSIAASVKTVHFTPAATVVEADPEVQWELNLPAHGTLSVGYRATVAPDGASAARLQQWANALTALQQRLHLPTPATIAISSLTITPQSMSLVQKESAQLTLAGQLASGSNVPSRILSGAVWRSSDPDVGYVTQAGVLVATGPGHTDITAEVAGALATATVSVSAPVVIVSPAPSQSSTGTGEGGGSTGTVISGYEVFHSCRGDSCGLSVHSGPGDSYPVTGDLANLEPVEIVCQASGEPKTNTLGISSSVWDKLASGGYVSDLYVDTPGVRLSPTQSGFTQGIPQCST